MKKYLSIILTLVMALGFSSAVAAADTAASAASYPYLYLNFEDSANPGVTNTKVSWAEGGAQGSGGSLYATGYDFAINVPSGYDLITKYPTKFSAWVKLDTTKTKLKDNYDKAGFIMFGPSTTKDSWFANTGLIVKSGLGLNSGEWVYFETTFTWDGKMMTEDGGVYDNSKFLNGKSCHLWPRIGDVDAGKPENAIAADSPTQDICYWLDDIRMEPLVTATAEEDGEEGVTTLFSSSFDSDVAGVGMVSYSAEAGADGKAGVAKCVATEGQYTQITLGQQYMKYNKLYRTTVKMKAVDDATVGKTVRLIYGRNKRLDKVNDPLWYAGDWSGYEHTVSDKTLTKDWQTFTFYIKRDVKTFDESTILPMFRVGKDKEAFQVLVDDIELVEFDNPANGDFEWEKEDAVITHLKDERYMTTPTDYERYGKFFGWFENGVDVTVSNDVDTAGGSEGTQSAMITAIEADGAISQGVFIPQDEETEIRFRAKASGSTVGKNVQVKLDRAVENKSDKDLYEVPDTEMLGENLTLTDEWQEFKIPYTFKVTTPSDVADGVGPRQPILSFVIENGAVGDTYYIDDLEIGEPVVEDESYDISYVDTASVSGDCIVGSTLSIDYSCVIDDRLEGGTNFVRVITKTAAGELQDSVIADSTGHVDYVVPESVKDKELYLDILPVTGNGLTGAAYRISVGTVKALYEISSKAVVGTNDDVTATVTVLNNDPTGERLKLFLAAVAYDTHGRAVRMESESLDVAADGEPDTGICTVLTTVKEGFSDVDCVKVYLWGGSSVFDTDMTPYDDVITVKIEK